MFEKCEKATENPDILLNTKETHWDFNNNNNNNNNSNSAQNNRNTGGNNGYRQNEKSFNTSMRHHQTERISLDQEIKYFLKENEHTLFDQNMKNLLKNTHNEQIQQINSVLDEMVGYFLK